MAYLRRYRNIEFYRSRRVPYKFLVRMIGDMSITNSEGYFASMVMDTGLKESDMYLKLLKRNILINNY